MGTETPTDQAQKGQLKNYEYQKKGCEHGNIRFIQSQKKLIIHEKIHGQLVSFASLKL